MLTSDAAATSRLTVSFWNAATSNARGSLHADSSGASVSVGVLLNVSGRFVPATTAAPGPEMPMNAAENDAGVSPVMLVTFTRRDRPAIVGRTITRTVLPASPGTT